MKKFAFLILVVLGCSNNSISSLNSLPENASSYPEPTRSNYLTGSEFCQKYHLTDQENGIWVEVPFDHNNPGAGTTKIYAWSVKPFNPSLPSAVFVDGGPGATSHGIGPLIDSSWNEIRFDQRGLGCSAPTSYEIYRDANFYSSESIARDMDLIRQAFHLDTWSVFGSSYGTIPATIYASKFPSVTRAVVLEGTVFDAKDIHNPEWKIEKYNEVFSRLTPAQIDQFEKLAEEQRYADIFVVALNEIVYANKGFRKLLAFFNNAISPDGVVNREYLNQFQTNLSTGSDYSYPQNPKAIDFQVYKVLFCKELGDRENKSDWRYDTELNKFVLGVKPSDPSQKCAQRGVTAQNETPYIASHFPISISVTYFQGSHDGATLARGAIRHWQTVPHGNVNFLLRLKGGHGPNISNLIFTDNMALHEVSLRLLYSGFIGEAIGEPIVSQANSYLDKDDRWILYHAPPSNIREIDEYLDGISVRMYQAGN